MKIGIDAFFLSRPFNGIGQVTNQVVGRLEAIKADDSPSLPAIHEWIKSCEFYLYTDVGLEGSHPPGVHERIVPLKWNRRTVAKKRWERVQLPKAVREDGCEVLISLYQSAAIMPRDFPHVMVVHDIIYAIFARHRNSLQKRLSLLLTLRGIRRASHCLAVSSHTKSDMIRHLGMRDEDITMAHIAAAPEFATPVEPDRLAGVLQRYNLTPGYIYHGGGLDERKNAKGVLQAYAILMKKSRGGGFAGPLPPLVISGGSGPGAAYMPELEYLAGELEILEHVVLLGRVPQADLPSLYKGAGVFLFPSRYEGFGLPVLEAMHQGVPVITANTSSLPEVGGDAVLYCDPDKPGELAELIGTVLREPELREKLSRSGVHRAAEFVWDSFLNKLMETAQALLKNNPGTSTTSPDQSRPV